MFINVLEVEGIHPQTLHFVMIIYEYQHEHQPDQKCDYEQNNHRDDIEDELLVHPDVVKDERAGHGDDGEDEVVKYRVGEEHDRIDYQNDDEREFQRIKDHARGEDDLNFHQDDGDPEHDRE